MEQKSGNKFFLVFGLVIVLIILIATFSISNSVTGNSIFDIFGKLFYSPQEVSVQGLLTSVTRTVSSTEYSPLLPLSVILNLTFDPADCGGAYVETIPSGFVASEITGNGAPYYNTNLNTIVWAPIDGPLCGGSSNEILTYNLTATEVSVEPAVISGQFSVDGTTYPNPDNSLSIVNQNLDFTISNNGDKTVSQNSSVIENIVLSLVSGEGLVSLSFYDLPENTSASIEPVSCLLNSENTSCTSLLNLSIYSLGPGTYSINVNATTGSITKNTNFVLTVNGTEEVVITPTPTPTKTGGKKSSSSSSSNSYVPVVVNNTPENYIISDDQLTKGYIRALKINDTLSFNLDKSPHSVKVLQASDVLVSLEVRSTPFNIAIDKSQPKDIDVNDDKVNDLRLRYDGLTLGKAIVYVQSLSIVKQVGNQTTTENNDGQVINQQSARLWLIGIIVLILVIVIILAIIKFAKKK